MQSSDSTVTKVEVHGATLAGAAGIPTAQTPHFSPKLSPAGSCGSLRELQLRAPSSFAGWSGYPPHMPAGRFHPLTRCQHYLQRSPLSNHRTHPRARYSCDFFFSFPFPLAASCFSMQLQEIEALRSFGWSYCTFNCSLPVICFPAFAGELH